MRRIICVVTDRRRLPAPTADALVEQVRAAAADGIQLVQLRERDLEARELLELARRAVAAVAGTATRILVNDRLDVALAAGAHGVHLRAASFAPVRVRAVVAPGFLIGRSVHSAEEASAGINDGADYLLFGNVFETTSKPGKSGAGLDTLAAIVRATPLPVLAIGGVTAAREEQVMSAGAAGFAAISRFAERH